MYDIISQLIDHAWSTGSNDQTQIYYICGSVIVILVAIFTDMIYRVFSHFWNGRT